mgnify:CR=1 FL=1
MRVAVLREMLAELDAATAVSALGLLHDRSQSGQPDARRVMQELAPQAQEVLREIIETDQIGLLLQQQAVIHADLGYNITAKVSDKMNQLGTE